MAITPASRTQGLSISPSTPHNRFEKSTPSILTRASSSTSALFYSANQDADGTGRGLILLGFALFVSVWMFSIPTEFRRAHICSNPACVGMFSNIGFGSHGDDKNMLL